MIVSTYDVISVGEIETSDIHAGVEHLHEHLDIPAGGSEGANDLGLALVEINSLKDVLESDATAVGGSLIYFYHSILTVSSDKCCSRRFVYLDFCLSKTPLIKLQNLKSQDDEPLENKI